MASQTLFDKDIRLLAIKEKRYFKVVGNPKELVIFVNPKGTKKFSLRIKQDEKSIFKELKEFREGIYSVFEARKEAVNLLKEFEKVKDINILKNGNEKYKFKNLFDFYIKQKIKNGLSEAYTKKIKTNVRKISIAKLGG